MENSSIYGVIKIDRDYDQSATFIKSIGVDDIYPFMNTNMFGLGEYVVPYYYDNMLITFATTYKGFGLEVTDWNLLILKIEHILRNVDFKRAQFHVNSWLGDFILYWANKKNLDSYWLKDYRTEPYKLIETEEFFFGFGDRGLITALPDPRYQKEYDELRLEGFSYPVKFSDEAYQIVRTFNEKAKKFNIGTIINYKDMMGEVPNDKVFEIIYDLTLKGIFKIVNRFPMEIGLYKHVDI